MPKVTAETIRFCSAYGVNPATGASSKENPVIVRATEFFEVVPDATSKSLVPLNAADTRILKIRSFGSQTKVAWGTSPNATQAPSATNSVLVFDTGEWHLIELRKGESVHVTTTTLD
jgi:hypothetical protein